MTQPNDPPTHIPPFVKPLAPYIKPRQEALRIRQALTSYLRSFIVYEDADPNIAQSHLALCAPTDAITDVKRIPADLPGLRREYLKALQANVAARKGLQAVSEDVASLRRQRATRHRPVDPVDPQEPGAELRDYLLLLRDRRRHAKLKVFEHYLAELQAHGPADRAEDLDSRESPSQDLLLSAGLEAEGLDRSNSHTDLEGLVHNLERAVVRARAQLDREKQLFERVKSRRDSRAGSLPREPTPAVKLQALRRTRDELVQWVEDRLISEGDPDESMVQELPPEEIEEAQHLIREQMANISEQYAAYLKARRELLDVASKACQPVTVTSKPAPRPSQRPDIPTEEVPAPDPLDVLVFATENLVPLSKSQKAMALQKTYLTGLLAKEKSTTLRALHRLRDESHLLPEYPILARQPRFKHAVAALNSRNPQPQNTDNQPDELVTLAEAWSFASNAAGSQEREYVQQKIALGTEVTHDARKTLGEVYDILNQDLDEVMGEGVEQDSEASDIWTSESRTRRGASGSRREKRAKGPWGGLNGRVGVE
ncbi:hypothetical protein N7533_012088 [Penicillium manginii]|jgi:hypothetical protein|uniref:uncharacterized protein n=1 Tax=Penicillium manginii TaxID=203109 RepID=UPI002546F0AE|nr:uncharacterized protein N7533_012088 [Penicillium manginii]KAJ5739304.1 hypothetical protein N7533_012088 [Penicillium manginii]